MISNVSTKISIVTVNYSFDENLIKTLNSVNEQNYTNFAHIIVASGCTSDDSDNLITKYLLANRDFIINQDTSIYNAMNLGLAQAKGNHV